MRPRFPIRRIPLLRPFRPPNTSSPRFFTQSLKPGFSQSLTHTTFRRPTPRPQFPYLSSTHRKPAVVRYISTETKNWLKSEFIKAGKYIIFIYVGVNLFLFVAWGIHQEWLNHQFPSPGEWRWRTRVIYRMTMDNEEGEEGLERLIPVNWQNLGIGYRELLERLEDPKLDGKDIEEQDEGGILVAGVGKAGYDITKKSEEWRRGYYGVLMGAANTAEHLDDWVNDTTRDIWFPKNQMRGPSNPKPKPIRVGSPPPPKEENCEKAYDPPEKFYMHILTTKGFTEKQRVDAALAYAAWLDFKKSPEAAMEMYKWAMDISTSSDPSSSSIDPNTHTLNIDAGPPSENLLNTSTALAIHHATHSNISKSLPIFLSILRARKSLPASQQHMIDTLTVDDEEPPMWKTIWKFLKETLSPPAYPPAPSDGTSSPLRNPKELCEEAILMTYIGEILYTSNAGIKSKEDGLAWTREAVDISEVELRKRRALDKESKKVCKSCLEVGLGNWQKMVRNLAEDEKLKKGNGENAKGGWLGFGGKLETTGRWEAEEGVVSDRIRRAKDVLPERRIGEVEDRRPPPPSTGGRTW
ncbi:hypothetical protein BCON_0246g00040 [Botryotinia convoluta]|uniref:MFS maltose permease n=1 Tax=Botryotinia convoluta TaxID=54673 RepID=A0A4Z1HGS7_9HELO|nr:hypothetical protein BCON_0246g00040 [Botryotinia convoluta]